MMELFQYEYVWRALLASSLVGAMCGLLGCFIVLRNMSLIGDALSHAILPGVVVGFMIAGFSTFAFFTGSVVAGLVAAILITYLQRNAKTRNDAAIGIVFTAMFSLGVMGISYLTRQEGVHLDLKDFLFGNVLGIGNQDLWLTGIVTGFVLLSIASFYRHLFISTFQPIVANTLGINTQAIHYFLMLLLSFSVVASLQSVGVILVVSMLIVPASTAFLLTNRLPVMLGLSALFGVISALLGMSVAIVFQTTPGPAMALTGTFFYLLAVLFSPEKGLISKWNRSRKMHRIHRQEDVLKAIYKSRHQSLTVVDLEKMEGVEPAKLASDLNAMASQGLLKANSLELTEAGNERALQLIRAHRLWESYLHQMGVDETDLHPMAETLEHRLHEEFLDSLDDALGNPENDPHGSKIPRSK